MSLLYGIHDREGASAVPSGGWCVDTVALSENPAPQDYDTSLNWLVRLNWGYGTAGTIPLPEGYPEYTKKALEYIFRSSGAFGYIIGNEPNHENERPAGTIITPNLYSWLFSRARSVIKSSLPETRVITAAMAPYHASPTDWLYYFKTTLQLIASQGGTDGIALHAYARGGTPSAITDTTKMGAPLVGQYNSFRTYRDALSVIPSSFRDTPVYITEFNPIPDWEDRNIGIVKAAYDEIAEWNARGGKNKIYCLVLFRWKAFKDQKYGIEDKPGVIADFKEAVERGEPMETNLPLVVTSAPTPPTKETFQRIIDPRATRRGVSIVEMEPDRENPVWKVKEISWLNEQEADAVGPDHHILFDTLDELGNRLTGIPILVTWPTGNTTVTSEAKSGEPFSANYPMSPSRNDFSVTVTKNGFSEMVRGIGMGVDTPGGFNAGVHTSTIVVFQRVAPTGTVEKPPIVSVSAPKPPEKFSVPALIHPVFDPQFRRITQKFGENPADYSRFKVDGVALKGHNGLDFGTPEGVRVVAVAAGRVVEAAFDGLGYGWYVKLSHYWGESLYAHLNGTMVLVGDQVVAGAVIGASGNTGNSTGPHLHFALRVTPFSRADGWGGFIDPLPYLGFVGVGISGLQTSVLDAIRLAAKETGVEWELLASLAWAESSFRPQILDGIFQIGDAAWSDWSGSVGALNKNNPLDNARVGAVYIRWLLKQTNGDIHKALTAYNWGIKNVLDGLESPEVTKTYVAKVIHGRDLLKAVGG